MNKKLIEVALPLEVINEASKPETENPFLKGHPRSLHNYWARTPLSVCRAVLFASLVDDPSSHPEEFPTESDQERERQRLFRILEDLVKWENTSNEDVLARARAEIMQSTGGNPPPVLDPFCGRGSIPLEAQRLGLETHASDLNPVAVLITKALIEIPPRFANRPPVHPDQDRELAERKWRRAEGLAEDVRYYGEWMRDEAKKRIGHLYPKVHVTPEMAEGRDDLKPYVGRDLTVIAWLWARTVKCPNPACGAQMPLVRSFWLSKKKGKKARVEPIVDREKKAVRFEVRVGDGEAPNPPKVGRGAKFRCLVCGETAEDQHIKDEGAAGRMGARLMAIVAQADRGLVYLSPTSEQAETARSAKPRWKPEEAVAYDPRNIWCRDYGLATFADLFTDRQLVALTTFSDLITEVREKVRSDAIAAGMPDDGIPLAAGGTGAPAYADAVALFLAFSVSRLTDYSNAMCTWNPTNGNVRDLFQRQAIPMAWDFAEANVLDSLTIASTANWVADGLRHVPTTTAAGSVVQSDARELKQEIAHSVIVCTDPPYYDNISYADLSDFFYVWLRRGLHDVFPDLLSTVLTPKANELVATPYRFGGSRDEARETFRDGFRTVFSELSDLQDRDYPMIVYYAYRQEEESRGKRASTGWETMLDGLVSAGFQVTATVPLRTTKKARSVARGTNALASTIVISCRVRGSNAPRTTRREFIMSLKQELPAAIRRLQQENIAPVDLAQAAIGPGMAIFSNYREVLEADGSQMSVRTALALINQELDEILAEQEGDYDPDTRWALSWFEQYGLSEAEYGVAETLSKAKNTSVSGLVDAGILRSGSGKVRLLGIDELSPDWDPSSDSRLTMWEIAHHLVRLLRSDGEGAAADVLRQVGPVAESARDLAYRLYQICERKGWAQEALGYNGLVVSWPEIVRQASESPQARGKQQGFDFARG